MRIPNLIKNSAIYSFVTVLQKGIMFFLLPVYTAFLSPQDYGVLNVVTSISSFISIFVLFSLNASATRFYYQNKDPEYSKNLWGTLTSFVVVNSIVIGTLFISLHRYFIDPFIGEINFYPLMFFGIVNVILSPLYLFFQTYLQTLQKGSFYGINSLIYFIFQVSLVILFLTIFNLGVLGVLLANVITSVVFFIYVGFVFLKKIKLGIKRIILKPALIYALPLLPHSLAAWTSGVLDRLLLNDMAGKAQTGLLVVWLA